QRKAEAKKAAALAAKAQSERGRVESLNADLAALARRNAETEAARAESESALARLAMESEVNAAAFAQDRARLEFLLIGLVRGEGAGGLVAPEAQGAEAVARAAMAAAAQSAAAAHGRIVETAQQAEAAGLRRAALTQTAAEIAAASEAAERRRQAAARREAELAQQAAAANARAQELARQAKDLKDLAARVRAAQAQQARQAKKGAPAAPRMLAAGGKRVRPAAGQVLTAFGAPGRSGQPASGVTLRTGAGAAVMAPADAIVGFSGPFRSYGHVLILDAGDGYALILTGLESAAAETGRKVSAGAVIGRMADAVRAGGALSPPELYFEVRQAGRPIDPERWLKAGKG
ncbi:MAG: murein hydrolase activator EnvC, partial [Hyphomonadaceae bacterium]